MGLIARAGPCSCGESGRAYPGLARACAGFFESMLSIMEVRRAFARAPRSFGLGAGVFSRSVSEPVRLAALYGGEDGESGAAGGADGKIAADEPEEDDGGADGVDAGAALKAASGWPLEALNGD